MQHETLNHVRNKHHLSTVFFGDTSGTQKVSGQERFHSKNRRFQTKILPQRKFQTLHRTTKSDRGIICYIQIFVQFPTCQEWYGSCRSKRALHFGFF